MIYLVHISSHFWLCEQGAADRATLSFVRLERASLSFAFLLYLSPLWRAACPQSQSSVGGPVIICLFFHLPTFMVRSPSG